MTRPRRPDFAIIGAMRAGTTQIYDLLRQVPEVSVAKMKETDFFCSRESVARGFNWYASQFMGEETLWGDVSPNYAKTDINPDAADLLYQANPDMDVFFVARDPVDRAISQYRKHWLEADTPPPETLLSSWTGRHILHASRYHACLEPFWARFGEKVRIIDFDDLIADPEGTVAGICETLGISDVRLAPPETQTNSTEELARRPRWWSRLRQSELGQQLRARLPRSVIDLAKRHVVLPRAKAPPPRFPDAVRDRLAEALADDAARFREATGRAFRTWSV